MPCNSDYLSASNREIELSKVACLLDELDGIPIEKNYWKGYHPFIYSRSVNGDDLISSLCEKLQKIDVSKQSLELQIWWRDHQAMDKARLEAELRQAVRNKEKKAVLDKLTPYEIKLLGLNDDPPGS